MKIFVTGITGHSGRFYTQRLAAEGSRDKLICLVRKTSNTDILDSSGLYYEKAVGDLNDVDFMAQKMEGCDMVVHIAGIYQSINVINAALRAGVRNAIVVHTTGMYSRFKSASADYIKVEEEVLSHRDSLNITVLRPTMIYGTSGDRNMYKLISYLDRHSFFPVFGSGKNLMQPVHAKDLGDAYYDVVRNWDVCANREYNLAGRDPIQYIEIIRAVERHLNTSTKNVKFPIWMSLIGAYVYNFLFSSAIISVEQVKRMMEDKAFPYDDARNDFGYSPMSFEDGIKGEVEEYLREKNEA
jgi:nucleoside-diphosphate-sugar epimerase